MENPKKPKKAKNAPKAPETYEDFLNLAKHGSVPERAPEPQQTPKKAPAAAKPTYPRRPDKLPQAKSLRAAAQDTKYSPKFAPRGKTSFKSLASDESLQAAQHDRDVRAGIERDSELGGIVARDVATAARGAIRTGGVVARGLAAQGDRMRETVDALPSPVRNALRYQAEGVKQNIGEPLKEAGKVQGERLMEAGSYLRHPDTNLPLVPNKLERFAGGSMIARGGSLQRLAGSSEEDIDREQQLYADGFEPNWKHELGSEVNIPNLMSLGTAIGPRAALKFGKHAPRVMGAVGSTANPWEEDFESPAARAAAGYTGVAGFQAGGKLLGKAAQTPLGKSVMGEVGEAIAGGAEKFAQMADQGAVRASEMVNRALPDKEMRALETALRVAEGKGSDAKTVEGIKRQIVKHAMKPDGAGPVTPGMVTGAGKAGAVGAGVAALGDEDESVDGITAAAFLGFHPDKAMRTAQKVIEKHGVDALLRLREDVLKGFDQPKTGQVAEGQYRSALAAIESVLYAHPDKNHPFYHASPRSFPPEEIKRKANDDLGIHLGDAETANERIGPNADLEDQDGWRVHAFEADLHNPIRLDDESWWRHYIVLDQLERKGVITQDEYDWVLDRDKSGLRDMNMKESELLERVQALLRDKGYDGFIYQNEYEKVGEMALQKADNELSEAFFQKHGMYPHNVQHRLANAPEQLKSENRFFDVSDDEPGYYDRLVIKAREAAKDPDYQKWLDIKKQREELKGTDSIGVFDPSQLRPTMVSPSDQMGRAKSQLLEGAPQEPALGSELRGAMAGQESPNAPVEPSVMDVTRRMVEPANKEVAGARHKLHQIVTGRYDPLATEIDIGAELRGAGADKNVDWAKLAYHIGQLETRLVLGAEYPKLGMSVYDFIALYGRDADGMLRPEVIEAVDDLINAVDNKLRIQGEAQELLKKQTKKNDARFDKRRELEAARENVFKKTFGDPPPLEDVPEPFRDMVARSREEGSPFEDLKPEMQKDIFDLETGRLSRAEFEDKWFGPDKDAETDEAIEQLFAARDAADIEHFSDVDTWPDLDALQISKIAGSVIENADDHHLLRIVARDLQAQRGSIRDIAKNLPANQQARLRDLLKKGGLLGATGALALNENEDSNAQRAMGFGLIGAVKSFGKHGTFNGRVTREAVERVKHLPLRQAYRQLAKEFPEFAEHLTKVDAAYKEIAKPKLVSKVTRMYHAGKSQGRGWYAAGRLALGKHFGDEANLMADLIAFFSQQQQVGKDAHDAAVIKYARDLGVDIMAFDKRVGGVVGLRPEKLRRVLAGGSVDGPTARKIVEFAEALKKDPAKTGEHYIVNDRHMAAAMGDQRGELDLSDEVTYDAAERLIVEIANRTKDSPENVQASIWFAHRGGDQTSLFSKHAPKGPADTYLHHFGQPDFLKSAKAKARALGELDATIVRTHNETGGSTFDPRTGENMVGRDVWAVGRFPSRTITLDHPPRESDIAAFKMANRELLSNPENHLGTWDNKRGQHVLDIVSLYPDKTKAQQVGRLAAQEAIFNLKSFEEAPVRKARALQPSLLGAAGAAGAAASMDEDEDSGALTASMGLLALGLNGLPSRRSFEEVTFNLKRYTHNRAAPGSFFDLAPAEFIRIWEGFKEKIAAKNPAHDWTQFDGALESLRQQPNLRLDNFALLNVQDMFTALRYLENNEYDAVMRKAIGPEPDVADTTVRMDDVPALGGGTLEYHKYKPGGAAGGAVLLDPRTGQQFMAKSQGYYENPLVEHTVFETIARIWPEIPNWETMLLKAQHGGAAMGDIWADQAAAKGDPDPFGGDRNIFIRPMADITEVTHIRGSYGHAPASQGNSISKDVRLPEVEQVIKHAITQGIFDNIDLHTGNLVYFNNNDLAVLDAGIALTSPGFKAVSHGYTGRVFLGMMTGDIPGHNVTEIAINSLVRSWEKTWKADPHLRADVTQKVMEAADFWDRLRTGADSILAAHVAIKRLNRFPQLMDVLRQEIRRGQTSMDPERHADELQYKLEQALPVLAALTSAGWFARENDDSGELAELADPGFADQITMAAMGGFAFPHGMAFRQMAAAARAFVKRAIGRAPALDTVVDQIVAAPDQDIVEQVFAFMRRPGAMAALGAADVVGNVPKGRGIMPPQDKAYTWQDLGWRMDETGKPIGRPDSELGPGTRMIATNTVAPSVESAYQRYTDALYILDQLHERGVLSPKLYEEATTEWRKWHGRQLLAASHFDSVQMSQNAEDLAGTVQSAQKALESGRLTKRMFSYIVDAADIKFGELRQAAAPPLKQQFAIRDKVTGELMTAPDKSPVQLFEEHYGEDAFWADMDRLEEGIIDASGKFIAGEFDDNNNFVPFRGDREGFASVELLKMITKAGAAGSMGLMAQDEEADDTYRTLMMLGAGVMTANAFGGFKTLAALGQESQKLLDTVLSSRAVMGKKQGNRAMRYLFNGYGLPETFQAMMSSARRQLAAEESMTLDALRNTDMTNLPEPEGTGRVRLQQLITGQIAAKGHLGMFSQTPIYQRYADLTKRITSLGMSKGPQARKLDIHDYHTAVVLGELMHGLYTDPTLWTAGPQVRSIKKLAREELKARRKVGALMPISETAFEEEVERITRSKTADEIRRLKADGYVRMPGNLARRTPLRGKWVRRDIVEELQRIHNTPQQIRKHGEMFNRLHTIWKRFHSVDNPATHVTNVITNMVTGEVSGVLPLHDPRTWGIMRNSFGELVSWLRDGKPSADIDAALKLGMLQGDLQGLAEFSRISSILAQSRQMSGSPTGLAKLFGKLQQKAGKAAGATQTIYQFEEQLFKLATFKRAIKNGATPEEAVKLAEKWFFDYSDVSPLIDDLRSKWWGIPFITWSVKMAPRAVELAADHPIKLMAGLGALTMISQGGIFPNTADEDLPWWIKFTPGMEEGRAMVNSVLPKTPPDSERPKFLRSRFPGDVNAVNVGSDEDPNLLGIGKYMPVPFMQAREPGQSTGNAIASGIRRSFEGPIARGLSELVGNKHLDIQGFRQPIMDENSSLVGQALEFGMHQAKDFLPPLAPGGNAWNAIMAQEPWRKKALEEFPADPDFQPRDIFSRIAHGAGGLNTTGSLSEGRRIDNHFQSMDKEMDRAEAGLGIPTPLLPKFLEDDPLLVGYAQAIEQAMEAGDMEKVQRLEAKRQAALAGVMSQYSNVPQF